VHILFVRGDRVLLLLRANTGYEDGNYSVPAGHLDGDEEVLVAATREAHEEIGVTIETARLVGVMHRLASEERIDFFVEADEWSGEIRNCEPKKCADLHWYDIAALPPNTVPYVRRAIESYRAGRWFTSFGWDAMATGGATA
jgi:8-oxo-dGTP pyrophosphatase MutT (NUDIX family)